MFPSVVKELDKNQHSRAFDVHEFTSNDDIEEKEAKLLYSLVQPSLAVSHQVLDSFQVFGLKVVKKNYKNKSNEILCNSIRHFVEL